MRFFVGIHHPDKAHNVERACISVHALEKRSSPFCSAAEWILDSGAFTTIAKHGGYPDTPEWYATLVECCASMSMSGRLVAAVSQDYMCEPQMLERTGLTIAEHQRLTIERYKRILAALRRPIYLMPVLQGYELADYVRHLAAYGDLLAPGAWVGVGSVCKRNRHPGEVLAVLQAIKAARPDLRLHGFGVKATALKTPAVRELLHSADSMAWSYAARRQGRDRNAWQEAAAWAAKISAAGAPAAV